jgi:hypothetical protein
VSIEEDDVKIAVPLGQARKEILYSIHSVQQLEAVFHVRGVSEQI